MIHGRTRGCLCQCEPAASVSLSHDVPLATSLGHCVYVLGSIQRTGEKLLLQYNTRQDSWCELLPTLTRADADLPTLYFLGVTDTILVIGGNNSENVVTSFCSDRRDGERTLESQTQTQTDPGHSTEQFHCLTDTNQSHSPSLPAWIPLTGLPK
ncbi:unnamed protein product [Pleuronectes platessa]|uniref:Uncharacterized protein n=1 Tax=Pleuronectes platessa TaxID=8262 RepID=A0A9N7YV47_PLEPL|nr:unnamed protein product [Pleuronectes platessa]